MRDKGSCFQGKSNAHKAKHQNRSTLVMAHYILSEMQNRPMTARILLVEEEPEAKALTLAMKAAGIKSHVEIINDPDKAVDYCKGAGKFADRREFPAPDLVLVDVKLGKQTGLEVLKRIRGDRSMGNFIVVMLSSSRHLRDAAEAYAFGANAFVVKPTDREKLKALLKSVSQFWLAVNVPPPII